MIERIKQTQVEIKLVNIPGAEDSDKHIFADGEQIPGYVYKGWHRFGGTQWIYDGPLGKVGASTLKDMKREIAGRIPRD